MKARLIRGFSVFLTVMVMGYLAWLPTGLAGQDRDQQGKTVTDDQGRTHRSNQDRWRSRRRRFTDPQRYEMIRKKFMQRRLEGIKNRLKATDEEWAVLEPLIKDIDELRVQRWRIVAEPLKKLNELLKQEQPDIEQLKTTMAEIRRLRKEHRDKLAAKRKQLQELLTIPQEAVLLSMGILD